MTIHLTVVEIFQPEPIQHAHLLSYTASVAKNKKVNR